MIKLEGIARLLLLWFLLDLLQLRLRRLLHLVLLFKPLIHFDLHGKLFLAHLDLTVCGHFWWHVHLWLSQTLRLTGSPIVRKPDSPTSVGVSGILFLISTGRLHVPIKGLCVLFGLIRINLLSILVADLTVHPLTLPYLGERLVIDPQVVFVTLLYNGSLMALPDHE